MQEVLIVTRFDSHPWTAVIKSKRQTVVFCYIEVQYRVYGNILYTCFESRISPDVSTIHHNMLLRHTRIGRGEGGRGLGPPPSENSNLLKFTNLDRLS